MRRKRPKWARWEADRGEIGRLPFAARLSVLQCGHTIYDSVKSPFTIQIFLYIITTQTAEPHRRGWRVMEWKRLMRRVAAAVVCSCSLMFFLS